MKGNLRNTTSLSHEKYIIDDGEKRNYIKKEKNDYYIQVARALKSRRKSPREAFIPLNRV